MRVAPTIFIGALRAPADRLRGRAFDFLFRSYKIAPIKEKIFYFLLAQLRPGGGATRCFCATRCFIEYYFLTIIGNNYLVMI